MMEWKVEDLHFSTKATFNYLCICGGANHILIESKAYVTFNLLTDKAHHKRTDILNWLNQSENVVFCKSEIYKHR